MRTLVAAALTVVLAGAVSAAPAQLSRRPSAQAIYRALLTTPVRAGSLPGNFYSAKVTVGKPSKRAKSHHVVGEVEIDIDSGDAAIFYSVFPTRTDAVADWRDADLKGIKTTLRAPQFHQPAAIYNGSFTGKNAFGKKVTNGFTVVGSTPGRVIVSAATTSTESTESGDIPGAIALERFELRHLYRIVNRLSRGR